MVLDLLGANVDSICNYGLLFNRKESWSLKD